MVELKELTLIRSGQTLFSNLNITFNSNDHWVITGSSGAGKTILLELLAGLIHPTKGRIEYDFIEGKSYEDTYIERKNKVHYIPAHAMQTFLSDNNAFYQQRYYTLGDERTPVVKDIIGDITTNTISFPESFNITRLLNLPVTKLSNGQLKKALILKSLTKAIPKMLLLDYPFEGLDYESRKDLNDFITHIALELNIQIILIDHAHDLPPIINKKLVLNNFVIDSISDYKPKETSTPSVSYTNSAIDNNALEPVVAFQDVTIQYGADVIIKNFNWTIRKGERWALVGKNGSGKTTLFSIIYADHPFAYSQKVYLFGKRRGSGESIWDIKKRINYLGPELVSFLNPQHILITADEYIRSANKETDTDKLEVLKKYFNAAHFFAKPVKQLSSSQLQLMLLIQFFLKEAELLLLDEPFQFLDPRQKERVSEFLVNHLRKETTLILITHYQPDVEQWTGLRMSL